MGQCTSTGMSRAFTLDELKDLKVGETKEMGKGCGPAVSGTQGGSCYSRLVGRGFSYPANGEFNWGGMGSTCAMCSEVTKGYGCDNCTGSNAIIGRRGTVKRISYLGDKAKCCYSGTQVVDGKTCDPKYVNQYATTDCDEAMIAHCVGDNIENNKCRQWISTSLDNKRSTPNTNLKTYCSQGKNYAKAVCQEWVDKTKNISGFEGESDQSIIAYCTNNPTDANCTCMKPPSNVSKIEELMSSAKVCWYKPCQTLTNDNYITSTMRQQKKNCTSTACLIEAGDIQVSGTDNKVTFSNDCVTQILKDQGSTGSSGTTDTTDTTNSNGTTTQNTTDNEKIVTSNDDDSSSSSYILPISGVVLSSSCCCCSIIIIIIILFVVFNSRA